MNNLNGTVLPNDQLDELSEKAEEFFPDVIGYGELVDSFSFVSTFKKVRTLCGVYKMPHNLYIKLSFTEGKPPEATKVEPVFEHVQWKDK